MDRERVKFILNKKSIITIVVIFMVIFILLIFLDVNLNPYPPKIVFIDKESNEFLDGIVLLDDAFAGNSVNGEFANLPDDFCKKEHTITLKADDKKYSWSSFPSDCELNYIIFKVEKEEVIEKQKILMRFFIKETQEPIKGELYFDDELVGNTDGEYEISKDECNSIKVINLKIEAKDIEWNHHSSWCDSYDLIEYFISQDELE